MNLEHILDHVCAAIASVTIAVIAIYAVSKGHDGGTIYTAIVAVAALNGVNSFFKNKASAPVPPA